jgi:type II secretory pathway component PulF
MAPALAQIALGVIVAAVVIAMYLPIFKLASLL